MQIRTEYRPLTPELFAMHCTISGCRRHRASIGKASGGLAYGRPRRATAASMPKCVRPLGCADMACDTAGHALALDTRRSELFCCVCSDYIFDAAFDAAVSVRLVVLEFPLCYYTYRKI